MPSDVLRSRSLSRSLLVSALSFAAVSLAPVSLVAVSSIGCGEPEEGFTYKKKVAPIFNNRCTICHRPGGPSGVDMQNPFVGDEALVNSVNRFATAHPELNLPQYNVAKGDPDNSFLMYKIDEAVSLPAAAGVHMPLQLENLRPEQVHVIEEWVKAGAPGPDTEFQDPGAPATADASAIEPGPRTFANDIQPIIGSQKELDDMRTMSAGVCVETAGKVCPRCIYCHYENGPNPPDLTAVFDPVKGLVNAPARGRADMKRVDPFHPENSLLIQKIHYENFTEVGVARSDYGAKMPYSFDKLTPTQVETVRQWIVEGANP